MFWALGAPWGLPRVCELGLEHQFLVQNTKNELNRVQVAPFGVSHCGNGVPGAPEPLGLLPAPKTANFFVFFFPILPLRP